MDGRYKNNTLILHTNQADATNIKELFMSKLVQYHGHEFVFRFSSRGT